MEKIVFFLHSLTMLAMPWSLMATLTLVSSDGRCSLVTQTISVSLEDSMSQTEPAMVTLTSAVLVLLERRFNKDSPTTTCSTFYKL